MPELPILVADDEPQVRSMLKAILTREGFTILEAEDGLKAWSIVQDLAGEVSLLISDIKMPFLDGLALCKRVRQEFPAVPIIVIAGHTQVPDCAEMDAFLAKPFTIRSLIDTVTLLARRPRPVTGSKQHTC